MAEWLEQMSQGHEMCGHDLEVMSLNPGQVELGVHSTSVPRRHGDNPVGMSCVVLE